MRYVGLLGLACVACSNGPSPNDAGADAAKDVSTADSPTSTDSGGDSGCASSVAHVMGTLLGNTFTPKDAMSTSDSNGPFFVLTDYAGVCALGANNVKANSSTLLFSLLSGSAFAVQSYKVPQEVDVAYATWDGTCNSPTGESGFSGTVSIATSDACGLTGTFDVTFTTDHITGNFVAPVCAPAPADAGTGCK